MRYEWKQNIRIQHCAYPWKGLYGNIHSQKQISSTTNTEDIKMEIYIYRYYNFVCMAHAWTIYFYWVMLLFAISILGLHPFRFEIWKAGDQQILSWFCYEFPIFGNLSILGYQLTGTRFSVFMWETFRFKYIYIYIYEMITLLLLWIPRISRCVQTDTSVFVKAIWFDLNCQNKTHFLTINECKMKSPYSSNATLPYH